MKALQAFVELKAAVLGLTGEDYITAIPALEKDGRRAMHQLGFTNAEIETSEFPDHVVEEGKDLIKRDPKEFNRRTKLAGQIQRAMN